MAPSPHLAGDNGAGFVAGALLTWLADQGIETNLIDPDRETSRRARLTSIREARPPLRGSKRNLGGTAVVQRTVIATASALDESASSRTR